jgi:anti-sigma regulatory factor (Ser/Thr protein kinase)
MPAPDTSSNGGAPSGRPVRAPLSEMTRGGKTGATIERLTGAIDNLRRGAAALKAENRDLRAELAGRERAPSASRSGGAPPRELGRLTEIGLPAGSGAPGAARMVVGHCLSGLVTQRILRDAQLLVSELVTNSLDHGELENGDCVFVRVYLAADTLRLEIENSGTAGVLTPSPTRRHRRSGAGGFGLELVDVLATRWGVSRNHSTNVWFEMTRT